MNIFVLKELRLYWRPTLCHSRGSSLTHTCTHTDTDAHTHAHLSWATLSGLRVQKMTKLPNKLLFFLLTAVCLRMQWCGTTLKCKAVSGVNKWPADREPFLQPLDGNGPHRIAPGVLPVKRDVAFNYLESQKQIAVKVSFSFTQCEDSGLITVAAVSELMSNRLGQGLLLDSAVMHRLIMAHAVTDTAVAGDLRFRTSGMCLNLRRHHLSVVSETNIISMQHKVWQQ